VNHRPVVEIAWNRFYDVAEIYALLDRSRRRSRSSCATRSSARAREARAARVHDLELPRPARTPRSRRCGSTATCTGTRCRARRPRLRAWYLLENYGTTRGHGARRRLDVLRPADAEPRRPRALDRGREQPKQLADRPGAGRRRPGRPLRRGSRGRPRRRRADHADAEVRAGEGHAPPERGRPADPRAGAARTTRASAATGSCSARKASTTTATGASTRTGRAATT
jgi:hypothetical protein